MSLAAMNYVMELREFPDGIPLDSTDKAVAFVLAHHHNPSSHVTWPSRETIAAAACVSVPTVKRTLASMESHLFIRRLRPTNQGRGQLTKYTFLALDEPEILHRLLEGAQIEPFFSPDKSGSEGVQPKAKRGSEGVQRRDRNKERTGTDRNLELSNDDDAPCAKRESAIDDAERELLRSRMGEWLGIDHGRQKVVSVDDVVLDRLIARCLENDTKATASEMLRFVDEKGPSLLVRREDSMGGWISEQKPGIKYPAMFLVAAVASCFEGPNSAARIQRRREATE